MARFDNEALTAPAAEFDPLTMLQCHQARLRVCEHAENAEDAALLMRMLGIFPGQEEDLEGGSSYPYA